MIVTEPTLVAACSPVNPIISAGAIAPTLAVVDSPVKPIDISIGDIEPTDEVAAEGAVKIYATSVTSEPTEEVVESPVNVNEISDLVPIEPTLEVAL